MSENDATRGIAGDRRRNPFPSLNDTEYDLLLLTLKMTVTEGVAAGMAAYRADNCVGHIDRTRALEAVVFGSTEHGVVGLDARMETNERLLGELLGTIVWFRRLVYGGITLGVIAFSFALIQFSLLGR